MLIVALESKNYNCFLLLNMILNSNKNNFMSVSGCLAKLPDDDFVTGQSVNSQCLYTVYIMMELFNCIFIHNRQ